MTVSPFKAFVKKQIFERRAGRLADVILRYINDNEKILDFGCGTLTVAEEIAKIRNVQIEGIDVINFNLTDLPFSLYDGERTDFEDNTFDTTYAAFVLHHCDDVDAVFEEILRITRKRIILIEDTYESQLELFCLRVLDYVENRVGSWRMNIVFNFKTQQEWLRFFWTYDIVDVHSQLLNPNSLRKHVLFVLDLDTDGTHHTK